MLASVDVPGSATQQKCMALKCALRYGTCIVDCVQGVASVGLGFVRNVSYQMLGVDDALSTAWCPCHNAVGNLPTQLILRR